MLLHIFTHVCMPSPPVIFDFEYTFINLMVSHHNTNCILKCQQYVFILSSFQGDPSRQNSWYRALHIRQSLMVILAITSKLTLSKFFHGYNTDIGMMMIVRYYIMAVFWSLSWFCIVCTPSHGDNMHSFTWSMALTQCMHPRMRVHIFT